MLGEQTFDALGKRWTLFLGNAAQCAVEERFDRGFFAVVADAMPSLDPATMLAVMDARSTGADLSAETAARVVTALSGVRVSVLREIAWAGLCRQHPDVTLDQVSEIIDDLGQERFGEIVGSAIRAAQGEPEVGDDAAKGKPATRASGRGGRTSSGNGAARGTRKPRSG